MSISGNGQVDIQPFYIYDVVTNVTVGVVPTGSLVTVFFTLPNAPPYSMITNATIYSGNGLSNTLTSISSQSSIITLTGLADSTTYNGFYLAFTYSNGVIAKTPTFSVTTGQWYTSNLSTLPYTPSDPIFAGGMCCSKMGDVVWAADFLSDTTTNTGYILYSSNYGQNFSTISKLTLDGGPGSRCTLQCDDTGNTIWFCITTSIIDGNPYRYVKNTDTLTHLGDTEFGYSFRSYAICANSSTNQYIVSTDVYTYSYSTDGGANFNTVVNEDIYGYGRITMDNTGQYVALISTEYTSKMLVSTNYGVNFNAATSNTKNFPISLGNWGAIQYNYSGSMLVAALSGGSKSIFTSSDHGATWNTIITSFDNPNGWGGLNDPNAYVFTTPQTIAVDITGTKIVLAAANTGTSPAVTIYSYNNGSLVNIDPSLNSAMPTRSGITSDISGNFYIFATIDSGGNPIVKYYK